MTFFRPHHNFDEITAREEESKLLAAENKANFILLNRSFDLFFLRDWEQTQVIFGDRSLFGKTGRRETAKHKQNTT